MVHLRENGFEVTVDKKHDYDVKRDKRDLGIPEALWSCHTSFIDEYVIEGHVPANDLKEILKTRPPILGLGVSGMKLGPPGMDGGGSLPFDVHQFTKDGKFELYKKY